VATPLVVILFGFALIFVACYQEPGRPSAKFIASGGFVIFLCGAFLLAKYFDQDNRARRQPAYYDHLRTEVPDKTNWGSFEIYPEKENAR
jgi:hypothetical protein